MCDLCNKSACPPPCPNYRAALYDRCRSCGVRLLEGDGYYQWNGSSYCEDCIEEATLTDLVRFGETEPEEILGSLGLRHGYFCEEE